MVSIRVCVKALSVEDNGNGTFLLELPAREMIPEQKAILRDLFPNLGEQVYKLLDQELLLASLATPLEAAAAPSKFLKNMVKRSSADSLYPEEDC